MKKKTVHVNNKLTRQFDAGVRELAPAEQGGALRYAMTLSSVTPYVRFGDLAEVWVEVLSHDPSAINLERADGMPLLMDHTHTDQVGVVEALTLGDNKLEAEVRFSRSERAQEIEQDVADKIRRNVSVGYFVDEYTRTGTSQEGYPIFTATRWTPYEASIVSVPADPKAGFGRAADGEGGLIVIEEETTTVNIEELKAAVAAAQATAAEAAAAVKAAIDAGETPSAEAFKAAADAAAALADAEAALTAAQAEAGTEGEREGEKPEDNKPTDDQAAADAAAAQAAADAAAAAAASNAQDEEKQADQQRALHAEIVRMSTAAGFADKAAGFIQRKLTADQAAKEILALRSTTPVTQKPTPAKKESPEMKYTLARAIQVALGIEKGGIEAEFDAKIAAALPDSYRRHGARSIFVPISAAQARALSVGGGAGAGEETVFTEQGEFIEMLRNRSVIFENGARSYTNLRGPVSFPRQVGGAVAHWVSENPGIDVEESQALFTSVTLSPKTLQSSTAISRQLLTQSAIDINSVVMDDLATAHALALDRAALHGAGGAEPVGIYNHPSVASVDMTTGVNHGKLVDMVTEVASANALIGEQAFVTTPRVAGRLAQTLVAQESGAGFIWTGKLTDGTVIGYNATASNQVRSDLGVDDNEHGLVFGTFSDVMVGTWGILEVVVDEYNLKKQGLVEITTFQMADVALRNGASFAKATGLKLA